MQSLCKNVPYISNESKTKRNQRQGTTSIYKNICAVLPLFKIFEKFYLKSLPRRNCSSYAKLCEYRLGSSTAKLNYKELCTVLRLFKIFEKKNTWSHFPGQNVVLMPKIINIGLEVWQLSQLVSQPVSQSVSQPVRERLTDCLLYKVG